jgi:hypothetical protein
MRETGHELPRRPPTFLNWSKVRRVGAVEVMLEIVLLFPGLDDISLLRSTSTVSAIIIFFENKVISSLELWLHYWLENLISVYLEGHLSVARLSGVKFKICLKVIPDCGPGMLPNVHFLVFPVQVVLNTIRTVPFTGLPDDLTLAFGSERLVYFIREAYVSPMVGFGVLVMHTFGPFLPSLREFLQPPPLWAGNTLVIVHKTYIVLQSVPRTTKN